ncbi:MAG: ATP-binding protein [Vagococcus salmoninarum]|uniref:ATP-binding protein n=1 Tax=Vagococcus salmoninarum TaxID=2739 RepID=UPI003F97A9FE
MGESLVAHSSVAGLITKGFLDIDLITCVVGTCPYCEGELREYIEPTKDTPPRCPPFCMHEQTIPAERGKDKVVWSGCGYKAMEKREQTIVEGKLTEAIKGEAFGFMKRNSVFTDNSVWSKSFENYKEIDPETKLAKEKAFSFIKDLNVPDSSAHIFMSGKTGVGKTHLGAAVVFEYLKQNNYKKECLLVSYRELLEQLKFAMNDAEARKKITGEVMTEIKRADLVLIDDLGANLGSFDFSKPLSKDNQPITSPTGYDTDTLNSLFEARMEKATIITTNLSSQHIKQLYGERVYSRIVNNVGNRFIKFEKTPDKRITGI